MSYYKTVLTILTCQLRQKPESTLSESSEHHAQPADVSQALAFEKISDIQGADLAQTYEDEQTHDVPVQERTLERTEDHAGRHDANGISQGGHINGALPVDILAAHQLKRTARNRYPDAEGLKIARAALEPWDDSEIESEAIDQLSSEVIGLFPLVATFHALIIYSSG